MPDSEPKDGRSKSRPGVDVQRAAVRDAAVRLFLEHGTGAVTVSGICEQAGVSRPTFYRCYPDKQALLAHVYDLAVSDHTQMNLAEVFDHGGGDVRAALERMVDRILMRPAMAAFIFVESANESSPAHAIVQAKLDEACARIAAWHERHNIRCAPALTIKATMVACQWLVHEAIRRGCAEEQVREAKDAMWALVRSVFMRAEHRTVTP